ncbi:hypothetical protein KSF73_06860 [Burkholderiaceae bacterium DAT-1]|nr:hypothetical protein [Burkholderiaceae bacterium DAT-1]
MPPFSQPDSQDKFHIRLMFDWGGGCLWAANGTASATFGIGAIEFRLPLSPALLEQLDMLSKWHDTALDWDNPTGPSPWLEDEVFRFEAAAKAVQLDLQAELGEAFIISYQPL